MRFLAAAMVVCAASACGGRASGPTKSTLVELPPIGSSDAAKTSSPRVVGRPTANVTASLLTYSGDGFWGRVAEPTHPLSELLRPCYEAALREDPKTAGWLFVQLDLANHAATRKDGSPLSSTLVGCVTHALSEVELENGMVVEHMSVYVSLSPE